MANLLFEIGVEELPYWYLHPRENRLPELLAQKLETAGLRHGAVQYFATPRRLAVLVHDIAETTPRKREERRGPPASAALTESGEYGPAAHAFVKRNNASLDDIEVRETDKGTYLYLMVEEGGTPATQILPELLSELVPALPAPRKMRWGAGKQAFLRPVHWLTALLDSTVIPATFNGLTASNTTRGHRLLSGEHITLTTATDYEAALREHFVIADPAEREAAVQAVLQAEAEQRGLVQHADPELLAEVTGLVEYPVAFSAEFPEEYLELPDKLLTTVMIVHQRFFPLHNEDGSLANAFVAVANNKDADPETVIRGYRTVLEGRLYDARFFWRTDRQQSLSQHAWALGGIAFQRDLGSMEDKVGRVAQAAATIADLTALTNDQREHLREALPLFKADLATEMVNEFPELEGYMGRVYATREGVNEVSASILEEVLWPRNYQDGLPQTSAAAVLAVADRLDKLFGFFALGKRPSGSADPFGLRRDAAAVLRIAANEAWDVPLGNMLDATAAAYEPREIPVEKRAELMTFFADRLVGLLQEQGYSVSLARAVLQLEYPVIQIFRRAALLEELSNRADFEQLVGLYKRAYNLQKKAEADLHGRAINEDKLHDPLEHQLRAATTEGDANITALIAQANSLVTAIDPLSAREEHQWRLDMSALIALKDALDRFLDDVLVLVDDDEVRLNRLTLLRQLVVSLKRLGDLEHLFGAAD